MDSLKLPTTAAQAKVYTAPNSLTFPQGFDGESKQEANYLKKEEDRSDVVEPNQHQDDGATSGIVPTLQNIVATVNLDCRLDLKTIALHARNAEYNPKRFAAVIMRIRDFFFFLYGRYWCQIRR